jgi:hypothetical protein
MQTHRIQDKPNDEYICVHPLLLVECEDKASYIKDVSLVAFVVNNAILQIFCRTIFLRA